MGTFYDLNIEKKEDALLLAGKIIHRKPVDALLEDTKTLHDGPDYPLIISNMKMDGRSKASREQQLSHPVNYQFVADVVDPRYEEAETLLANLICENVAQLVGSVSLVCYGERLFFRKIGESITIYNHYLWNDDRKNALLAAFPGRVEVHDEDKFL